MTPPFVQNKDAIIANGKTQWHADARAILLQLFERGLDAVNPRTAVQRHVMLMHDNIIIKIKNEVLSFPLDQVGRVFVVGGGKATAAMATAIEDILGNRIIAGEINVPDKLLTLDPPRFQFIQATCASHPIPNQAGMDGVRHMIDLSRDVQPSDLVFCLLSGGGSALMPQPVDGITLEEKQALNQVLIDCGATIQEINTVRKHVSKFKGGWLAKYFQPATVIGLILSDVVGDEMSTIASGPTVPDPTTFSDVLEIFERRNITDKVPASVKQYILQGMNGEVPETPKPGDEAFKNVQNIIIGSASIAAMLIKKEARMVQNINSHILTDRLEGEASVLGKDFATLIEALHRRETRIDIDTSGGFFKDAVLDVQYEKARGPGRGTLLTFTGESTVTIKGNGVGGRNQEMLLATSIAMNQQVPGHFAMLGCGMDGIEGNSTAAGAIIDDHSIESMENAGLDPQQSLENNDSYTCFSSIGDAIITGPTGTNVNDLGMIFLDVPISSIKITKKS